MPFKPCKNINDALGSHCLAYGRQTPSSLCQSDVKPMVYNNVLIIDKLAILLMYLV